MDQNYTDISLSTKSQYQTNRGQPLSDMEVQIEDLKDLAEPIDGDVDDVFHWRASEEEKATNERFSTDYSVLKQSLISSPIVKQIFKVKYSTNKKVEGLSNEAYNDDGSIMTKKMMKDLSRPNPDSFDMDIDDDLETEMLKYTTIDDRNGMAAPEDIEIDLTEEYRPQLADVLVLVRHSSIVINNEYEVKLPSTVRSSNLLKGSKVEEGIWDEDSLLITLSSGFLLLVRFFQVNDSVKPYVVQWWKASSSMKQHPTLDEIGKETLTHPSGSLAALTSAQGHIRLFHCSQTAHGVMLDNIQNINFDGQILHSCFLKPLKDVSETNHALIFTLIITSHRRYMIRLFECWLDEKRIIEHSPFLLTNEFDVPVFVVPFKQGVFLMMEKKIVIITVNQMLSADYNFLQVKFSGAFPTGYYEPKTKIAGEGNEILISTEDGTIYSIIVVEDRIHVRPILRVPKLSHFILERVEDGFALYYSCSFGYGGYRLFPKLLSDEEDSYKYLLDSCDQLDIISNWAPLLDVEVVDTRNNRQELWLANARSLSRLRYGYRAEKEIQDNKLRKAYKVFNHVVGDDLYFIFSFIDKTLVFKYEDDQLIDVEDSGLELINRTINISSVQSICVQVLERSIIVTDFASENTMRLDLEEDMVLADSSDIYTAAITESISIEGSASNNLSFFESSGDIHLFGESVTLKIPVTFLRFFSFADQLFLAIGGANVAKIFKKQDMGFNLELEVEIEFSDPNDFVVFSGEVFISSRLGEFSKYSMVFENEKLALSHAYTLRLSESPIEFSSSSAELFLISKYLWKLNVGETYPSPVIFDEPKERSVYSVINLKQSKYALLRDDGFSFVNISNYLQPILRSIKLSQVPRRVKYISHLNVFAIISESSLLFTSKVSKLETRLYSRRQSSQSLFEDEIPLSLSEWILPTTDKAFRNLLIGCRTSTGGSIKVLQPKFSLDSTEVVEAYEIYSAKTDAPVLAFEQLNDDTVIYSSGFKLIISTYDLEKKKMLDSIIVHEFNSLIMNIDVKDDIVLVSTKDYSVSKFKYSEGELSLQGSDYCVRKVTNSLSLNDNVTITTDKLHCSISGIQGHETRFRSFVSFVPKLKRCELKPLWYDGQIMNRFIAYGLGGEIQLYTLLDKETAQELAKHLNNKKMVPNSVTQKGLWDLNDNMWVNDRNVNVIDGDLLLQSYSGELAKMLNAISF